MGAILPFCIILATKTASTPPDAPRVCPVMLFVELMASLYA